MKKKNLSIIQPNAVTNARYEYTALQKNIMYFIIDAVQKHMTAERSELNQDLFGNFEIEMNVGDVAKGTNYEQIMNAVKDLMRKPISYYYNRQDGCYDVTTVLIFSIIHKRGSGKVLLKISADSIPALLYIGGGFTAYNKVIAVSLTSVYAKRMYELLCRWRDKGFIRMTLAELRKMLCIEKKFKQISELRCDVLDKSARMLKEGADYWFTYELKKERSRSFNVIEIWVLGKVQVEKRFEEYRRVYGFLYSVYSDNRAYDVTEYLLKNGYIVKACERLERLSRDLKDGKVKKHGLHNYLRVILIKEFKVSESYIEEKKTDPGKVEQAMSRAKAKKDRLDAASKTKGAKKIGEIMRES
jgi:plasmid replication initiation protein